MELGNILGHNAQKIRDHHEQVQRRLWNASMMLSKNFKGCSPQAKSYIRNMVDINRSIDSELELMSRSTP